MSTRTKHNKAAATLLGSGYLCSDDDFECAGDDAGLADALAACSTPDPRGWRLVALRNWRRTWRWYGTTSSGQRVYVQVQSADRHLHQPGKAPR